MGLTAEAEKAMAQSMQAEIERRERAIRDRKQEELLQAMQRNVHTHVHTGLSEATIRMIVRDELRKLLNELK